MAWICDDSKPKWSGGGCVCVHSIYNRPPPGVIIGPIIPDGSRAVGRSENPGGQVVMWWAYLPLPHGWDRVTWFVKIGWPIAPLPPPGSDSPGQWCVSPLLFWTKLTRCDVNFYGVNMDGGFFWIRRCSFSGTKEGSFTCGSLCDRGRVASVICKALGGSWVLLVSNGSQVIQFADRALLVSKNILYWLFLKQYISTVLPRIGMFLFEYAECRKFRIFSVINFLL